MLGYLICALILVVLYVLLCNGNNNIKDVNMFLIAAAVLMTVFYGFRASTVGSDTISYIGMFYRDGSQSLRDLWDYAWKQKSPGYVLAEWVFYHIIPSARLWLIITSAFFFFGLSNYIKRHSNTPLFSYFIFFTVFGTFQMTGLRQSLAMVFLMNAYTCAIEKRLLKFSIYIAIGYLFHQSALVFLPVYFLVRRKVRIVDIIPITIGVLYMYKLRIDAFNYIKEFTSYYYFEVLNHEDPINFSIMIYTTALAGYIVSLLSRRKEKLDISNNNTESLTEQNIASLSNANANILYLACLFMPMVAVNGAVRRIVMYFSIPMIFVVPQMINSFLRRGIATIVSIGLCIFLLFLLLRGVSNSSYAYEVFFLSSF